MSDFNQSSRRNSLSSISTANTNTTSTTTSNSASVRGMSTDNLLSLDNKFIKKQIKRVPNGLTQKSPVQYQNSQFPQQQQQFQMQPQLQIPHQQMQGFSHGPQQQFQQQQLAFQQQQFQSQQQLQQQSFQQQQYAHNRIPNVANVPVQEQPLRSNASNGTYYFPNGEVFRPRNAPSKRNRPGKMNHYPQQPPPPPPQQQQQSYQQQQKAHNSYGQPIGNVALQSVNQTIGNQHVNQQFAQHAVLSSNQMISTVNQQSVSSPQLQQQYHSQDQVIQASPQQLQMSQIPQYPTVRQVLPAQQADFPQAQLAPASQQPVFQSYIPQAKHRSQLQTIQVPSSVPSSRTNSMTNQQYHQIPSHIQHQFQSGNFSNSMLTPKLATVIQVESSSAASSVSHRSGSNNSDSQDSFVNASVNSLNSLNNSSSTTVTSVNVNNMNPPVNSPSTLTSGSSVHSNNGQVNTHSGHNSMNMSMNNSSSMIRQDSNPNLGSSASSSFSNLKMLNKQHLTKSIRSNNDISNIPTPINLAGSDQRYPNPTVSANTTPVRVQQKLQSNNLLRASPIAEKNISHLGGDNLEDLQNETLTLGSDRPDNIPDNNLVMSMRSEENDISSDRLSLRSESLVISSDRPVPSLPFDQRSKESIDLPEANLSKSSSIHSKSSAQSVTQPLTITTSTHSTSSGNINPTLETQPVNHSRNTSVQSLPDPTYLSPHKPLLKSTSNTSNYSASSSYSSSSSSSAVSNTFVSTSNLVRSSSNTPTTSINTDGSHSNNNHIAGNVNLNSTPAQVYNSVGDDSSSATSIANTVNTASTINASTHGNLTGNAGSVDTSSSSIIASANTSTSTTSMHTAKSKDADESSKGAKTFADAVSTNLSDQLNSEKNVKIVNDIEEEEIPFVNPYTALNTSKEEFENPYDALKEFETKYSSPKDTKRDLTDVPKKQAEEKDDVSKTGSENVAPKDKADEIAKSEKVSKELPKSTSFDPFTSASKPIMSKSVSNNPIPVQTTMSTSNSAPSLSEIKSNLHHVPDRVVSVPIPPTIKKEFAPGKNIVFKNISEIKKRFEQLEAERMPKAMKQRKSTESLSTDNTLISESINDTTANDSNDNENENDETNLSTMNEETDDQLKSVKSLSIPDTLLPPHVVSEETRDTITTKDLLTSLDVNKNEMDVFNDSDSVSALNIKKQKSLPYTALSKSDKSTPIVSNADIGGSGELAPLKQGPTLTTSDVISNPVVFQSHSITLGPLSREPMKLGPLSKEPLKIGPLSKEPIKLAPLSKEPVVPISLRPLEKETPIFRKPRSMLLPMTEPQTAIKASKSIESSTDSVVSSLPKRELKNSDPITLSSLVQQPLGLSGLSKPSTSLSSLPQESSSSEDVFESPRYSPGRPFHSEDNLSLDSGPQPRDRSSVYSALPEPNVCDDSFDIIDDYTVDEDEDEAFENEDMDNDRTPVFQPTGNDEIHGNDELGIADESQDTPAYSRIIDIDDEHSIQIRTPNTSVPSTPRTSMYFEADHEAFSKFLNDTQNEVPPRADVVVVHKGRRLTHEKSKSIVSGSSSFGSINEITESQSRRSPSPKLNLSLAQSHKMHSTASGNIPYHAQKPSVTSVYSPVQTPENNVIDNGVDTVLEVDEHTERGASNRVSNMLDVLVPKSENSYNHGSHTATPTLHAASTIGAPQGTIDNTTSYRVSSLLTPVETAPPPVTPEKNRQIPTTLKKKRSMLDVAETIQIPDSPEKNTASSTPRRRTVYISPERLNVSMSTLHSQYSQSSATASTTIALPISPEKRTLKTRKSMPSLVPAASRSPSRKSPSSTNLKSFWKKVFVPKKLPDREEMLRQNAQNQEIQNRDVRSRELLRNELRSEMRTDTPYVPKITEPRNYEATKNEILRNELLRNEALRNEAAATGNEIPMTITPSRQIAEFNSIPSVQSRATSKGSKTSRGSPSSSASSSPMKFKRAFPFSNLRKQSNSSLNSSAKSSIAENKPLPKSPRKSLYEDVPALKLSELPSIETESNLFGDMMMSFDQRLNNDELVRPIRPLSASNAPVNEPFLRDDELTTDQIKDQQMKDSELSATRDDSIDTSGLDMDEPKRKSTDDLYMDDNIRFLQGEYLWSTLADGRLSKVLVVRDEEVDDYSDIPARATARSDGNGETIVISNEQLCYIFNNLTEFQRRHLPPHLKYIKQFRDYKYVEISVQKFEDLEGVVNVASSVKNARSLPILKTRPSIHGSRKKVMFSNKISVSETFAPDMYKRYNKAVTQYTLTESSEISKIKNELNYYKCNEMLVHESSQNNTHFFY
ncbi:uncharacterized protein RJT20DRAFT_134635 [Scheffersomyces xylosifermentans]|uniref:uncharacterized protein n=1 Tax=Scheffersomyces xylosifermentans TaxID=1304137 RepID=UPI00315D5DDF